MKKIGIFCSASENIDKMYFDSARQIGEWMGKAGKTLIYGGANLGLMECVARAVKENGGTVIGVIPAKLERCDNREVGDIGRIAWWCRYTRRDFPRHSRRLYRISSEKGDLL